MPRFKSPGIALVADKVRPYLTDYLEERGAIVNDQGRFRCINPEHEDKTPSMCFDPHVNNTRVKCFGCGAYYDIFRVASILEGKPDKGPGWVYQNVYYLAKKFGISFEEVEPTQEELLYMEQASIFDDAAHILQEKAKEGGPYLDYAMYRGLIPETCIKFGVAQVSWDEFAGELAKAGHDLATCANYGINRDMFDADRITFTLKDASGFVVGFARKFIGYNKEAERLAKQNGRYYPPKYVNTSKDVLFFDKSSLLYGFHYAKKFSHLRLDLYEGYFDFLYCCQSGIDNCAALCSTSFTENQIKLVQDHGFRQINLVLDSEERGQAAADKIMGSLAGREGLYATVTFLPFEDSVEASDRDPDEFIKRYGLKAYQEVKPLSGFEWKLGQIIKKSPPEIVCETMIPYLLNEPSKLRQGQLVTILARATACNEEDIRAEIQRLTDRDVINLGDDTAFRLSRAKDAKQRVEIIKNAAATLDASGISNDGIVADLSFEETCSAFAEACSHHEVPIEGIGGWKTGWNNFDTNFDGLVKEGGLIGIAGAPNSGKSAWLNTLTCNLLTYNPDGLSIIFHVLDDPRAIAFAKLMACLTGLPIGHVIRANKFIMPYPDILERYERAKAWTMDLMKKGKLIIKGQETGNDTDVTTQLIDNAISKTGNQIIYIGDSLHSLDDKGGTDERIRYKRIAEWAMRTSETRKMTMVFTVELTKMGMEGRPRIQHLSETGKLAYAMKAIGLVYNELHDRRGLATTVWTEEIVDLVTDQKSQKKRPIIEVEWVKNKISGEKGMDYMKFFDHMARVEEMTLREVMEAKAEASKAQIELPSRSANGGVIIDSMNPSGFALA